MAGRSVNGFDPTGKSTSLDLVLPSISHVLLSRAVSSCSMPVESLIESARQ
jgi:hypothetical protein